MIDTTVVPDPRPLLDPAIKVVANEPMRKHTTLRVGGPADWYVTVRSAEQLRQAVQVAGTLGLPLTILGGGANILVSDRGIRGMVIENRARAVHRLPPTASEPDIQLVRVESGAHMAALARTMARAGLTGLEWAAGIPGTIGGAVVSNAGAYGGAMQDVLVWVETCDYTGVVRRWTVAELEMGYRTSRLRAGHDRGQASEPLIVLQAMLQLRLGDAAIALARIASYEAKRRAAQPPGPSAGSMFKNPPGDAAGRLIEQAGLKGLRIGDAQISPRHANFFVNHGTASAADIKALMDRAQAAVAERFGIWLEPEVLLLGEW
jgi:UDP-N-acetylmuramate dehydrogenase